MEFSILWIVIVLCVMGLILWIIEESKWDSSYEDEKTQKMKVVDLSYKAEESSSSISPTFVGGKVGFSVNSHHEDERHIVALRSTTGRYRKLVVDSEAIYDSVEEGDSVPIKYATKVKIHRKTKQKRSCGVELISINGIENFDFIKSSYEE